MKHRKTIVVGVIVLAISFILIALSNSTYALFSSDNYANRPDSYTTGLLQIVANSQTDNISLDNVLPISDEEGSVSDPYTFTIKNVGNLDYEFDIKLLSTGSDTESINSNYIKIKVNDNDVKLLSECTNGVIVDDVTLSAGESIDISIRVWLSLDTPNSEIGKTFNSKIVTDGKAVYTNSNYYMTTFADYITNLYIGDTKKSATVSGVNYNLGTTTGLVSDKLGGKLEYDGGNIRYYGSNPKNYVYFNCTDYLNQNDDTCEKWRIVGVVDGKVKLMRAEPIGKYSYDYTSTGTSNKEWSTSTLRNLLNDGYYNNKDGVVYYNGSTTGTTIDFATSGIGITDATREKNLISTDNTIYTNKISVSNLTASGVYLNERKGDEVSNDIVSLPLPSDYGFAVDLSKCSKNLIDYGDTTCSSYNWMVNIITGNNTTYGWLLRAHASTSYSQYVWAVNSTYSTYLKGRVNTGNKITQKYHVVPTVYLNDNVIRTSGTGTSSDPYKISDYDYKYDVNAVDYITKLYLNNKNKTVTNNSIEYQYAESVNLMNDRLGGTTSDYDAGNIRYYGANPNNYVDIGDRTSDGKVIPYRIIGVFKDVELSDGSKQDLIKVIRAESIGYYHWDNKTSGIGSSVSDYGSGDWRDSRLMMLLNPGYDRDIDGNLYSTTNPLLDSDGDVLYGYEGSLWWNSKSGTCYSGECDFTSYGLSGDVHNKIETVVWNINMINEFQYYSNTWYTEERKTAKWQGKVALMYPSDYGYATDFNNCSTDLIDYYSCSDNDWLYVNEVDVDMVNGDYQWLLGSGERGTFGLDNASLSAWLPSGADLGLGAVHPTFYIKSDLKIMSGDGTSGNPYVIG